MKQEIDFVITWVDGNDSEWIKEKSKYSSEAKSDKGNNRYRDWDILRYWFRGIENHAPWVRKVHFVTWGHTPKWLNKNHPKLNIVKHKDFIPEKYLPTFNSRTIDLNLHRINDLSEKFVYFNDDMFILREVKKKDFFKDGLPCDTAILHPISSSKPLNDKSFAKSFTAPYFNTLLINTHFSKKRVIKRNLFKWFNIRYRMKFLRTLLLMPWSKFPGFMNYHLPYSYNKSTFKEVWDKEYNILNDTCKNKFRENTDVNNWIITYWQFAKGEFTPRNPNVGKYYPLESKSIENEKIYSAISRQKHKLICINDVVDGDDELIIKQKLKENFSSIFPSKSEFEKD